MRNFGRKIVRLAVVSLFLASPVLAIETGLNETAAGAGLLPKTEASLAERVGTMLGAGLALVGVIFLVLMVYGGYLWMTARGDTDRVNKAKELITSAIIGLVIITGAYVITSFVLESVFQATIKTP